MQWVSQSLGRISPIPWPLWLGSLFPLYAAVFSIFLWSMRGTTWPVRCIHPDTVKKRPCEQWVAGEWYRCRYHNQPHLYRHGRVDTSIRRWQGRSADRNRAVVDLPATGQGIWRRRPPGIALFYQNGYVRTPGDVIRIAPFCIRRTVQRLSAVRLRLAGGSDSDSVAPALAARNALADKLDIVSAATRFAAVSFGAGLLLTLVSVVVSDIWVPVAQWLATLGFVVAWAAISSGVYLREELWLGRACMKSFKWWAYIFVPVAVLNIAFTIANQ